MKNTDTIFIVTKVISNKENDWRDEEKTFAVVAASFHVGGNGALIFCNNDGNLVAAYNDWQSVTANPKN